MSVEDFENFFCGCCVWIAKTFGIIAGLTLLIKLPFYHSSQVTWGGCIFLSIFLYIAGVILIFIIKNAIKFVRFLVNKLKKSD